LPKNLANHDSLLPEKALLARFGLWRWNGCKKKIASEVNWRYIGSLPGKRVERFQMKSVPKCNKEQRGNSLKNYALPDTAYGTFKGAAISTLDS
jgi:hypothetical protein